MVNVEAMARAGAELRALEHAELARVAPLLAPRPLIDKSLRTRLRRVGHAALGDLAWLAPARRVARS